MEAIPGETKGTLNSRARHGQHGTGCCGRMGNCWDCFCNTLIAPHEESFVPVRCPPRKYILSRFLARIDPNAYNPFDEFYSLHEAYALPLIGFIITLFGFFLVAFYLFLQYSNFAAGFSPNHSFTSEVDGTYEAKLGGCADSSSLSDCDETVRGNIFVAFMLSSGQYLAPSAAGFALNFTVEYQSLNGTTAKVYDLPATSASSASLLGNQFSRPVWYLESDTQAFLQRSISLDTSVDHRIVQIVATPTDSSYSNLTQTLAGGSFEIYQYIAGSTSIKEVELITNPKHWRITRWPWVADQVQLVQLNYMRKTVRFTSRYKYGVTEYEFLQTGNDVSNTLTLTEANAMGYADPLVVVQLTLDPAEVEVRYERETVMDYMSNVGGVAFLVLVVIHLIARFCTTEHGFRLEKTFKPRKSAFERMVRKKKEELEYYRLLLLINPRVAADADVTPQELNDFLKFKQGEELARFVHALEKAFAFQARKSSPLEDVKRQMREEYGEGVLSKNDFAYSNDTVDIDEKDTSLNKIINIITAEKLQLQIDEISKFLKFADKNLQEGVREQEDDRY